MKKNIIRIVLFILIIVISTIIFDFSAQDGETSGGISKKVITVIADILNLDEDTKVVFVEKGEGVIRKLAHFGIYTLLGLASMGFMATFNIKRKIQVLITIIWGFLYASTDELHQMFINGRTASFLDVLLDTSGIIFGVLIIILSIYILKKINKKKNIEKNI